MVHSAHIFIEGRVHGVFFRRFVQTEAINLQITGWVRNLSDGRVEALGQHSDKPNLEKLIVKCKQGPPLAVVENIQVEWDNPVDCSSIFKNFTIETTV
jgi:acylphosphatase